MKKKGRLKEVSAPHSRNSRLATPGARMPVLVGCKIAPETRLKSLRVAIIGCGSIGMRVALHLTRLGIAELILVDPKLFKSESLLTHEIAPAEVGEAKALAVDSRCKEVCPSAGV